MKIIIAGTLNKDLILPFGGSSIQSFGGIFFTTSALSNLHDPDLKITPISFVGEDVYNNVLAMLGRYKNVAVDGLIPLNQKNHEVILEYISPEERKEKALFSFPSLNWSHLENHNDADFYIVNMITGWDMTLEAFKELSKLHYDRIYLDVHFLVMGIDSMGKRFPRRPDNIMEWVHCARFVQMNQREFETINYEKLHEIAFFEKYCKPDQILIVTLAGDGSRIIFRKNEMVRDKHFPAYAVDRMVDATGCGDVFGAGFVYRYLKTDNLYDAIDFANGLAAAKCMLKGTTEMELLLTRMSHLKRLDSIK